MSEEPPGPLDLGRSQVSAVIVDVASAIEHALAPGRTEVGRARTNGIVLTDPTVSRLHCAFVLEGPTLVLEALSPSNAILRNGLPLNGSAILCTDDEVVLGERILRIRLSAPEGVQTSHDQRSMGRRASHAPQLTRIEHTVIDEDSDSHAPEQRQFERIPIEGTVVFGRDHGHATVRLDHPLVSRRHLTAVRDGNGVTIIDLGSANGTFVNGVRINAPVRLKIGDSVKVGPFLLHFAGDAFSSDPVSSNAELICRSLSRIVKGTRGEPVKLLDDISLVFRPREFVCIIGPSGSGKSTLLNALAARAPASNGRVELNGLDLYANFDSLKGDIALVPQKEVVHGLLTVEAALHYTAHLRLPPDMSIEERASRVEQVLDRVGLSDRRSVQIRRLSGGQLKRVSLANEILSQPSLLFLDEVTSGLDEHSDGDMMRLFRQVAHDGSTVVCITHSLSHVAKTSTLVVILSQGGRLAFVGTPSEACDYFGIGDLGSVYQAMEQSTPDALKQRFQAHPLFRKYVFGRLPPPQVEMEPPLERRPPLRRRLAEIGRQSLHLTRRYAELLRSDLRTLVTLVAQPVLVCVILSLVTGQLGDWPLKDQAITLRAATEMLSAKAAFFFLLVAAFWFGTNNAAKEIVKEREIYLREQAVMLKPLAYLLSKFALLGAISLIQVALLFGGTALFTNLPGSWFLQWVTLSQISLVGTALGLLISSTASSEDRAVTAVPLCLIPQVILTGAFSVLTGAALWISRLVAACYWANESLMASVSWPADHRSYWPGLLILTLHLLVFAIAAIAVLEIGARRLRIRALLRAAGIRMG